MRSRICYVILLYAILLGQAWASPAPAHDEPHSAPSKSVGPPPAADTKSTSGFKFTLASESPALYLARLEQTQKSLPGESVGEVILRWTTPEGQTTSIPVRQVSATVWASQIALERAPGKNKLALLIIGKNREGMIGKTVELLYELDLPSGKLAFLESREPRFGAPPALPRPVGGFDLKAVSIPVVALLVGFANLLLLLPGLLIFKILRRFSIGPRRPGAVLSKNAAALHPLYGKMLAGAGLINRHSAAPLEWGAALAMTQSGDTDRPAVLKEALEATVLDDDSAIRYTIRDIKKLSTEELVNLVADAIDRLEKGKVDDEIKVLIKAAEKELAAREHKSDTQAKIQPEPPAAAPSGALSESQAGTQSGTQTNAKTQTGTKTDKTHPYKTIEGQARLNDSSFKLDLKDLSF